MNPSDLDYRNVRRIVEERVAAVMSVPAMRAGLGAGLDRSTYANYQEAGAALWEDCLVPLLRDVADVLTAFLLPQYGDGPEYFVEFDFTKVGALQESEDAKFKRALDGYDSGFLTKNEARAVVGRESEGPAGDVFKVKVGEQLVPWQTPAENLQPAPQQTAALEALARKSLKAGAVAGYLAAKAEDAKPSEEDWPEVRRVLESFGVEDFAEHFDGKGEER